MKVIVTSATGAIKEEALLNKESGVLEFESGEISHILYEKNLNKTIFAVKEEKKKEVEPVVTTTEQSTMSNKKAKKR